MNRIRIDMNQSNIISTLTGEQFYGSPFVCLRELLQNAYDACYTRQALEWSWGTEFLEMEEAESLNALRKGFKPEIRISFQSANGMLSIEDNGIGMNAYDLEKFVTKIGVSYYTSADFRNQRLSYEPISRFGIGLLSCFKVSRAILIESKKDRSINTAWNIMNRQSLEPIAAKWFKDAQEIEYIQSNRTEVGTKITLALQTKYAMELTMSSLVRMIQSYMAYQPIPIEVYFDNRKTVLQVPSMNKDNPYAYVLGITTLRVQNDLLEGYIVIHNSKHSHLIEESELFQQGFRVTDNLSQISLKPEWIRHMAYHLNIKSRFLNLTMDRDGVANDDNLKALREQIGQLIVQYFSKNPLGLSQYLNDGTKSIIPEYDNEVQLLEEAVFMHVYLKEQEVVLPIDTIVKGFVGKEIRIAAMSQEMFYFWREKYALEFKQLLKKYNMILFDKNYNIFMQFLAPYLKQQRYIISSLPGIVYTELQADIQMKKSPIPYRKSYQLYPRASVDDMVFCFATNDPKGTFEIIINENHRNAQLLARCGNNPFVCNIREVIIENIKQRIINSQNRWDKIIDFGGSFIDEWKSEKPITVQSIWCLEDDFANSVNAYIRSRLTDMERIDLGLDGLVFHKQDFISWWYAPK